MTIENNQGQFRKPRAIVRINDIQVNFIDIEIRSGAPYTADTYFLEIPLNEQSSLDLSYFASTEKFSVKIYVGFPNDVDLFTISDLQLMIQGESNDVEINPSEGLVSISGRDLSSRLIDKKVTKSFSNITASELAIEFANDNNLKPEVVKTDEILGTFLQTAQTYTANNTTQWDMLVQAAMYNNFNVFVKGESLFFKPNPIVDDNLKPYILNYSPKKNKNIIPVFENGTKINFFKNNIVSGNIDVTVKVPYSTYTGKAFHVKQSSRNKKADKEFIRKYVYSHPGLTQDQAVQKAKQLINNLVIHSVKFTAEMIGDIILSKDMVIQIIGTNTDFDQMYYIDSIVRKITINDFSMFISAKNKPDQMEIS